MIVYIIAALLVFGILIAVHELGHFLAAKACGVPWRGKRRTLTIRRR